MTELEQKAEEYVINLQKEGFNCFSCYDCKFSKDNGFRTGVPEDEFFNKVEKAYKDGYEQGQKAKSLEVICKDCSIQKQISKQCDDLLKENAELKEQITKMHKCLRCVSNDRSIDEEPCKNCLKDGIYTNWH